MPLSRRQFLASTAAAVAARPSSAAPVGWAEHCIVLWMGGGMSHVDTFDPKRRGDPKSKLAGSDGDSIPSAVAGVRLSEHLPKTAPLLDRATAVRTLTHGTIDEHATASYFAHTGRAVSETIRYPSLGSLVVHGKPAAAAVPGYVVVGIPNVSRDPGFLGPKAGYLAVSETDRGPDGFTRPVFVSDARQKRRDDLLGSLKQDESAAAQAEAAAAFRKLAGPQFLSLFDLAKEPAPLREKYGQDFGQRCLLARRLVQAGVRFVEVSFALQFVNGAGWDTHNDAQRHQPKFIAELDAAFSTLLLDLEAKKLLDKTLVVIATEFGRPPQFDAGGGRGHQSKGFTGVLAGGGLKHRGAVGRTTDLGGAVAERPVTVPDFHATILAAMGLDPHKEHYDGNRPVPATDGGTPIAELFA